MTKLPKKVYEVGKKNAVLRILQWALRLAMQNDNLKFEG